MCGARDENARQEEMKWCRARLYLYRRLGVFSVSLLPLDILWWIPKDSGTGCAAQQEPPPPPPPNVEWQINSTPTKTLTLWCSSRTLAFWVLFNTRRPTAYAKFENIYRGKAKRKEKEKKKLEKEKIIGCCGCGRASVRFRWNCLEWRQGLRMKERRFTRIKKKKNICSMPRKRVHAKVKSFVTYSPALNEFTHFFSIATSSSSFLSAENGKISGKK